MIELIILISLPLPSEIIIQQSNQHEQQNATIKLKTSHNNQKKVHMLILLVNNQPQIYKTMNNKLTKKFALLTIPYARINNT
jgi:uncharacterized protein YybS (DUF2232 family)